MYALYILYKENTASKTRLKTYLVCVIMFISETEMDR